MSKNEPSSLHKAALDQDIEDSLYLYPQRRGLEEKKTFWHKIKHGAEARRHARCVSNVSWCIRNDPWIKLLLGALKSQGCPFDTSRHVSCEDCRSVVNGGYDVKHNQIVVCQNNSNKRYCCNVLAHELIHMFDYCRAKVDFTNPEHLACTEIRASNFTHCSIGAAVADGVAQLWDYENKKRECVKQKALTSVLCVRSIQPDEAVKVVEKVFNRCYNDLEPFGRIPRRSVTEDRSILSEASLYGYSN